MLQWSYHCFSTQWSQWPLGTRWWIWREWSKIQVLSLQESVAKRMMITAAMIMQQTSNIMSTPFLFTLKCTLIGILIHSFSHSAPFFGGFLCLAMESDLCFRILTDHKLLWIVIFPWLHFYGNQIKTDVKFTSNRIHWSYDSPNLDTVDSGC